MRKHFLFSLFAGLMTMTAFATTIGPQSLKVTLNGNTTEGWTISNNGSAVVSNGVANVTMGVQKAEENKYRADWGYTDSEFTFDKSKDVIWAIKLTGAVPGEGTPGPSKKFRIKFENTEGTYTESAQINATTLDCSDGGKIYYVNASSALSSAKEGDAHIEYVTFIFADAVIANSEDAHYSVDWIASFASLNDLTSFKNWNDEDQDATPSLPYYEVCFRPKADGSGYDDSTPYNGFYGHVQFEGNYNAKYFALEYFLLDDFSDGNVYTLSIETNNGGGTNAMAVWDLDEQIDEHVSASAINTKATSIIGIAPTATEGATNTPIASSNCVSSFWTFTIPAYKLTPLATYGNKTLVGLFVTSQALTSSSSCKFATSCYSEKSKPSMTKTGFNAVINTTNVDKKQWSAYAILADAVTAASENDVITLFGDVTISGSRQEIKKALTIQGATGAEKILCNVAANSIMVLANGEGVEHTLTFKNLVIDGNNIERGTQTLEAAGYANLCLDGVRFVNTSYSIICGDVKNTGNKNVILQGVNSIPNGIYLNMNKRVDGQNATHATPIKIYLASDYVEGYVVVLCSNDPTQYEVVSADNSTGWLLEVSNSGSCSHELKAKKCLQYDLEVKAVAKMATMVIGFDAALPEGVRAYQLVYDDSPEYADGICAYEESVISKNKPVLIIAEPGTYSFKSIAGATLDEQADPTYGALKGVYASGYVPACTTGVYNYILTNGNDGVGFYQVADATNAIGAHRAYLSCGYNTQAGGGSAPRRMVINFDAHKTPTAVEQISNDQQPKAEKLLINGVLYIRKADRMYRIDGQIVK